MCKRFHTSMDINKASGSKVDDEKHTDVELPEAKLTDYQISEAEYKWYVDTYDESGTGPIHCVESVLKEVYGDDWEDVLKQKGDFMEVVPSGKIVFMLKRQRADILYNRRIIKK